MLKKFTVSFITLVALGLAGTLALAQTAAPTNPVLRLRGVIEKIEVGSVTIKERRGETIKLVMADNMPMNEVYPIAMTDIKAGSFIGTAAMPKPDGTLEALEVLVFPEAMRGTGEGHNPWDLQKDSTMTNATVADLKVAPNGRQLRLTYKGGEKIVNVADGAPIVTFRPGEKSLLVVGAKVLIQTQEKDGKPTALRMTIGRDGFAPPM
jgi:hypothetical protein